MKDPDGPSGRNHDPFVDRISESEALRDALRQHTMRILHGLVDAESLRNVLTFYGDGGMGKTELSRKLASWITGDQLAVQQWGKPPSARVGAVARWDMNDSRGGLDPLSLLIALRSQLGTVKRTWPPFDLAFASFYRVLRPGLELRLKAPHSATTTMSDILAGLTGDASAGTDFAASGGLGAGAFALGRSAVGAAHSKSVARRTMRDYPQLQELISDCDAMSGSIAETAQVAGRVAFMLTQQIDQMSPPDRPLIVIFVDHMERLQVPGERHLGEATLNRLISRLPYFLFVVTGRNSLRWHKPTPDLPASGGRQWPLLSTERPPTEEPRQHLIGYLSAADAEEFLRASFARYAITVTAGLDRQLAEMTAGWPLHLQTIVDVARERSTDGQPLTADDLGGPLPTLVERLLSDLPADVAEAFRAACLLPYFDVPFAAAAGEVRAGAVEQLVLRQAVRLNTGSVYPYRIHDTLRALVRDAGADAAGGWGSADWLRHARLAFAEAERRFTDALAEGDDVGAIQSLALGLNIATDHALFAPWLVDAIRKSPNMHGLASLLASKPRPGLPADLVDVLEFLHLRVGARVDDVTTALGEIVAHRTAISSTAGLWRAYDLRNRGHTSAAIEQLEELVIDFDDRPSLYRNQIVTTMRMGRHFVDALAHVNGLTEAHQDAQRRAIDRAHGTFDGSSEMFETSVRKATSRRHQVELMGDLVVMRHREHGVSEAEVRQTHATAVEVGHASAQASCAGVLAEMCLFDEAVFDDCVDELVELSSRNFQPYRSWPQALALRAWAIGSDVLARQSHAVASTAEYRSTAWIATEILLENLGHPLVPLETQWLEPYEDVRDRWLALLGRIVDRARHRSS